MFRGADYGMVRSKGHSLIVAIENAGGNVDNLSFNRDNKVGSDLLCETTGVRYEIKLGNATHGAIGLKMSDALFAQTGASVKSINDGNKRRKLLSQKDENLAREDFFSMLEDFYSKIKSAKGDEIESFWANHILTSYHSGINVATDIKKSFDDQSGASTPTIVIIKHGDSFGSDWTTEIRSEIPVGSFWIFDNIGYTDNGRLNVRFGNNDALIRMTLNQKNSYYRNAYDKANKLNGLGWGTGTNSLSWNLWVKSE